jgi:hypothetical protein
MSIKIHPRSIYIEELITFIDQLIPAAELRVQDTQVVSEEAAAAVAELLLEAGCSGRSCSETTWREHAGKMVGKC